MCKDWLSDCNSCTILLWLYETRLTIYWCVDGLSQVLWLQTGCRAVNIFLLFCENIPQRHDVIRHVAEKGNYIREVWANVWRLVLFSNSSSSSSGFPVLCGMLTDWCHVKAEGAWWNTNPYRSMRSKSLSPLSLGSMVAAGSDTSVPRMKAPG